MRRRADDPAASPVAGPDDVAEHRAGLDRRELAGIADQDEPGVGPHRLDQPGHQRQRHHRGLVDDHDVVRQPVAAVVAEAAVAAGPPAEQPVQRRRVAGRAAASRTASATSRPAASSWTASSSRAAALPVGAASATSGGGSPAAAACSASSATIRATVVVLPGARPAGDDREAAQHRRRRGQPLAGVATSPGNSRASPSREHVVVDGRGRGRRRTAQVGGDLALLAPVAVEVEPRCRPAAAAGLVVGVAPLRRRRPAGWPRSASSHASGGSGHGSAERSTGSSASTVAVVADRRQVDEDVAEARAADGQRGRQRTGSSCSPASSASRRATWTSAADSTPGVVERAQQPGRVARAARGRARRWRSAIGSRTAVMPTAPVEQVAQRLDERGRRAPGEHAARLAVDGRRVRRRSSRAGTGRGRRRGCGRGRSRAAASAGSGAARRCRAAPAGRSGVRCISLGQRRRAVVPGRQRLARRPSQFVL